MESRRPTFARGMWMVVFLAAAAILAGGDARAEDAVATGPSAAPPDCDALTTDAEQAACQQRELDAAEARHRQLVEACKKMLPADLASELVGQERAWRSDLEGECTDPPCLSDGIRQRDKEIAQAFPQCGPASGAEPATGDGMRSVKTGMLPARWTPPGGPPQDVPFSFEARSKTRGTMSTTLGDGGEEFHGSYVQIERSLLSGHDDFVTGIYDSWSGPAWEAWGGTPDDEWTETGISFGDFARFYTGRMLATLDGNRGSAMRCQFQLRDPASGLGGGGTGTCQTTHGGTLSLQF